MRVLRGSAGAEAYSPQSGYRYDGLYRVTDHWSELGEDGFRVFRYRLEAIPGESAWPSGPHPEAVSQALTDIKTGTASPPDGEEKPGRKATPAGEQVERNPAVTQWVKEIHAGRCQVCGDTVETPVGALSHGAHIQALAQPHCGPDVVGNVLCLCPNCHGAFDAGAIWLTDDHHVVHFTDGDVGKIRVVEGHELRLDCIKQHRSRFA